MRKKENRKTGKNGRSFREDMVLIRRGIREFGKILPGQMRHIILRSIFDACIPFLAVFASARILDELALGRGKERLIFFCLLAVGGTCLLSALKSVQDAKVAVGNSLLFASHEICLTQKTHRLPYEVLEMPEPEKLRAQVSGSISVSGAGMASLYWDMEVVVRSLCRAVAAVLLGAGFLRSLFMAKNGAAALMAQEISGSSSMTAAAGQMQRGMNGVWTAFFLVLLTVICTYISCKMAGKRFDVSFEVFLKGAQYNRYGEFYTMNYLPDEDAAMDTRIFAQEEIVLRESQEKCYQRFAQGKRREIRALNYYDSICLGSTCLCGVMVYALIGRMALYGAIGAGEIVAAYAAVTMLISAFSEFAQILTDLRNNNEHLLNFFRYMDLPENGEEIGNLGEGDCKRDFAGKENITGRRKFNCCKKGQKKNENDGQNKIKNIKSHEKNKMENMEDFGRGEEIKFEHVSFRYPNSDVWALQDICFSVRAGEKLALVGQNGSGKTTLVKLLCRLYRPTQGRILLHGVDIWSYPWEEYREKLAAVFQDFSLFAFSVAENVAASECYDKDRVEYALKEAGVFGKVERLPGGIAQPLFHDFVENGCDLSGGEAQKIAIARAVYKDAAVMVLDEPTAALDPFAEAEIYENFRAMSEGKTAFLVSHRLSSCKSCDRVAVFLEGRPVQFASHEELVRCEGEEYFRLWEAQAQYYA